MTARSRHRLTGLEPDNLLAFLALLGCLRALEQARPAWCARAFWSVDEPPVRPILRLAAEVREEEVAAAVAEGLASLAEAHDFGGRGDLTLSPEEARDTLERTAQAGGHSAQLWSALVSDGAMARDGKKVEPTPLCLMFGQGHQHFLARLASVPVEAAPPSRGRGGRQVAVSPAQAIAETLFAPWTRPDPTFSFRWDPQEDVRYALRATNPTDAKTKERTQHGANRLAAIGLSAITVVPRRQGSEVRLAALGGHRTQRGEFELTWPIWREPASLAAIRALLGHPRLEEPSSRSALGIVELRRARRISAGKFMNFTRAEV